MPITDCSPESINWQNLDRTAELLGQSISLHRESMKLIAEARELCRQSQKLIQDGGKVSTVPDEINRLFPPNDEALDDRVALGCKKELRDNS